MAIRTKKAIGDTAVQDIIDSCTEAGDLDEEKAVTWLNEIASRLARRANRLAENANKDAERYIKTVGKDAFKAFHAAEEAKRVADGAPTE